jgi:flagellar motor switch protein FliN/FliY
MPNHVTPINASSSAAPSKAMEKFQFISDITVTLTAELDRRSISFGELVRLEEEGVVILNRPAGENIDLFVGDVLLGSGEILVIDGVLAIRVADLRDSSPAADKINGENDDDAIRA